ncbi:hypothetical protein NVP1121O_130 [Vibrio phage 1.121.O._10N.286.46.C4]|nr:hypothetical protein NVP1121O_130 [Vibrio phage 1.121.O._10N.286.46.C4]
MKGTLTVLTSSQKDFKQRQVFWFSELEALYKEGLTQSRFKPLVKLVTDKGVVFLRHDPEGVK